MDNEKFYLIPTKSKQTLVWTLALLAGSDRELLLFYLYLLIGTISRFREKTIR